MNSSNDKITVGQVAFWFIVVTIVAIVVCCVGCAPMISSGEIVGKQFVPAHSETNVMVVPDSNGGLTTQVSTDHIPDRWYITFEKRDEDNKMKSRTIGVSQEEYDRYRVGEWISLEQN